MNEEDNGNFLPPPIAKVKIVSKEWLKDRDAAIRKDERERAWKIVHTTLEKLCIPLTAEERGILREADVKIAESLRSQPDGQGGDKK